MSHEVYTYNNFYSGGCRPHRHCGGYNPYRNPYFAMGAVYNSFAMVNTAMGLMNGRMPSMFNYYPNSYSNSYSNPYYAQNYGLNIFSGRRPQAGYDFSGPRDYSALRNQSPRQYNYSATSSPSYHQVPIEIKPFDYEGKSSSSYQFINSAGRKTSTGSQYPDVSPRYTKLSGNQLNAEFLAKAKSVAANINCDVEDLLAVMNSESGIDSQKWNKSRSAVGLIQFTDIALADLKRVYGLSYTKEDIAKMPALEQLDLAEKFYKLNTDKFGGRKLTAGDLYAITYVPAFAANEVLTRRGDKYYKGNEGLDTNDDGIITKTDLNQHLAKKRVNLSTFA